MYKDCRYQSALSASSELGMPSEEASHRRVVASFHTMQGGGYHSKRVMQSMCRSVQKKCSVIAVLYTISSSLIGIQKIKSYR